MIKETPAIDKSRKGWSLEGTAVAPRYLIWLFFFLSGVTGLVYEVLWLKELRHLFGSTVYATASTLSVFFLGLACGGYVWGKRCTRSSNPLRTYAWLELGIGLAAMLYFILLDVYAFIYTTVFASVGHSLILLTGVKLLLALALLFPAAFFMGGTFPVVGQILIRHSERFGSTVSILYGVNTLGAALGAFAAGFYLPVMLGFKLSYVLAIMVNVMIAASAWYLSRSADPGSDAYGLKPHRPQKISRPHETLPTWRIATLGFGSGFITLGMEVLWTRMFAQVLMNDIYSFATILITFLMSLAGGGFLAHVLCRGHRNPWTMLYALTMLTGIGVGLSPLIFYAWTGGLEALAADHGWGHYILGLFAMAAGVMLVPGILMGSVFPMVLRIAQGSRRTVSETLGFWTAVNTIGAILGSLTAGFLLLPGLGLWASIGLLASLYFGISIPALKEARGRKLLGPVGLAFGCMVMFAGLPSYNLPSVLLDETDKEVLLDSWYGGHGVVSVVQAWPRHYPAGHQGDIVIRMNNHYSLGGLGSLADERRQAHLPLWLHPEPRSVFFLGLATGITAGGALYHPVERVVVCELVPEVVVAAKKYFGAYTNGLFSDERVRIVVEDGRNYLLGTAETFDVIIGDLFNLWAAGVGSLYTVEHFQSVRNRLNPGGIFAQWLPLYQISEREFGIIVRTMLEVFPQVTLWRGNFVPEKPIVALIGQTDVSPLRPEILTARVQELARHDDATELLLDTLVRVKGVDPLEVHPERKAFLTSLLPHLARTVPFTFYAGNLALHKDKFQDYPVNTDNRPVIEFLSPKTPGAQRQGKVSWFTMRTLSAFFETLAAELPSEEASYLKHLSKAQMDYLRAGLSYYKHIVYQHQGRLLQRPRLLQASQRWLNDYIDKIGLRRPTEALAP